MLIAIMVSSCSVGRYLEEEDYLLVNNKVSLEDNEKLPDGRSIERELMTLIRQKPNRNLLGIPREWIYLRHADPQDTGWYDNWARDRVGEPPTIVDTASTYEVANAMAKYLRNKKGFYNASVQPRIKRKGFKAKVTYEVDPGTRHYIDSVFYVGSDANIIQLMEGMRDESLVDQGDPADAALFDLEKNRIIVNLQNMGYADFVGNYIQILGDSTGGDHKVDIFMRVIPPLPDSIHRQYRVGDIRVFTDHYKGQLRSNTDTLHHNNRVYHHELRNILVKPSVIDNAIYLEEGNLLTRNQRTKTYRKLSDLSTYRFVAMTPAISKTEPDLIDYDVYLTPHQNKWISESNFNVYYSNFTQRERQLIGLGAGGGLTNRNLLGGAEQFKVTGEGSIEFDPVNLRINRFNISLDNSLQIPKLVDYAGVIGFTNRIGILTESGLERLKREAKTNLKVGFNRSGIVDFYGVSSFNAAVQYQYKINDNAQVSFTPTAFSLNDYSEFENFDITVGNNPFIINTFADNLITGYFFHQGSFKYSSESNARGFSWSFISDLELSGWETYLTNELYNQLSDTRNKWQFLDRFEFSQYAKVEADLRGYKVINQRQQFATRLNIGVGSPFGSSEAIPFIKQFGVGGPNSLRAWDQLELGPGSYDSLLIDPIIINGEAQLFYQRGDIRLEFNAEYRMDLFWVLEGALFADIGNVWTLKADPARPGSQFTRDFYRDLAIAAGWGIRFDFDYFIIRFDFGYRMRNPYPDRDTGRYWNPNPFKPSPLGNLQVAVNYPF
jgi:outer membrane protein assembly factor BamA